MPDKAKHIVLICLPAHSCDSAAIISPEIAISSIIIIVIISALFFKQQIASIFVECRKTVLLLILKSYFAKQTLAEPQSWYTV